VIGGGFSGLTAAVETAEAGFEVIIAEKTPFFRRKGYNSLTNTSEALPPNCGLEMNYKRIKNSGDITFYTLAEVEKISGQEGNYDVTLKISPRFVNDKCVGCNACAEACPVEMPNEFNFGLDKTKAHTLRITRHFLSSMR